MGTVLASKIIADASEILGDPNNALNTTTKMLKWLNLGQRAACTLKPDINIVSQAVICVAGAKQTLPTGGLQLMKVTRNMGTTGTTPGVAVTLMSMEKISAANSAWASATGAATTLHYMYDPKDPTHFYVYPPQPSSGFGYLELVYAALPSDVGAVGSAINIDDIYELPLMHYCCYMGFSQNAALSPNAAVKAAEHHQEFLMILDRKDMVEKLYAPITIDALRAAENAAG